MGSFFGPPIRVGIPIGVGVGFKKKSTPSVTSSSTRITAVADVRTTATGDTRVTA